MPTTRSKTTRNTSVNDNGMIAVHTSELKTPREQDAEEYLVGQFDRLNLGKRHGKTAPEMIHKQTEGWFDVHCDLYKHVTKPLQTAEPLSRVIYDEPADGYRLYVRGFDVGNKTVARDVRVFTTGMVKFGIANSLNARHDGYGDDRGRFYYVLDVKNEEQARVIERCIIAKFKQLTVGASHEYLHVTDLKRYYADGSGRRYTYAAVMKLLFAEILVVAHQQYDELRLSYGYSIVRGANGTLVRKTASAAMMRDVIKAVATCRVAVV